MNEPTQLRPGANPRLVTNNSGLMAVNLTKSFRKRPVLRGVSISVQRGEAVGLLGPNGAGKTTCFYIMTGLLGADNGWVMLNSVSRFSSMTSRWRRPGSTISSTERMFCSTLRPRKIDAS